MLRYFIRRVLLAIPVLLGVATLVFSLIHLVPGDPAQAMLGDGAAPQDVDELRKSLGLDQPLFTQYVTFLRHAVTGDLGVSFRTGQPVTTMILERVPATAELAFAAMLVAIVIAIPLGVVAAMRRGGRSDAAILTSSYVGISIPEFVIGPLLIMLLASPPLRLFPSSGHVPFANDPLGWLWHVALPVMALTIVLVAHLMRQTRSGMLDVLASDYVRTARLKGLPEKIVIRRHALRNALTTTIVVLALDVGYLMGSIVVVEEIFAYPGLGRLIIYAVGNRDLPLVQGTTLVIGAVYVAANLLADLVHGLLNPRVGHA